MGKGWSLRLHITPPNQSPAIIADEELTQAQAVEFSGYAGKISMLFIP